VALPPAGPGDVAGLPADVALVHAFINTLDLRGYRVHGRQMHGGDAWDTPQALAGWLREHRLLTGDAPVTAADLDHARRLRAVLRDSTRQPPLGRAGDVTTTLTGFPLVASAGPGTGIRLTPPGEGADAALTRVLITAAELSARGLWARLKMCPAIDCQWIFFDRSRPGRGRWCSPDLCGNRLKKRAQRQRQGRHRTAGGQRIIAEATQAPGTRAR
jgi:predicted RNA-binding Zn ribbon-like protein